MGVVTVSIVSNAFAPQGLTVRSPSFSFIASDIPVSVPGISAIFGKFLNCFANALDKDLSESPHFPGGDLIQGGKCSYRVLSVPSDIHNFSPQ